MNSVDVFNRAINGDLTWFIEQDQAGTLPDLMKSNSTGEYVHEYACEYGHLELLRYLLEECSQRHRINLTVKNSSALQAATRSLQLPILKYLTEGCPQKDQIDITLDNNVLIRWAAIENHLELLQYFLEACIQRDRIDVTSEDSLMLRVAAANGNLYILKYLLENCPQNKEFDITIDDNCAFRWASQNGHFEVVKYLLEDCPQRSEIDVTARQSAALQWATRKNFHELADYLDPITEVAELSGPTTWPKLHSAVIQFCKETGETFQTCFEELSEIPQELTSHLTEDADLKDFLREHLSSKFS